MKDQEFADRVDAILAKYPRGHESHRALDMLWMEYAQDLGGPVSEATAKWFSHIEGDHDPKNPYPLGRVFAARPRIAKLLDQFSIPIGYIALLVMIISTLFNFASVTIFGPFTIVGASLIFFVLSATAQNISKLLKE